MDSRSPSPEWSTSSLSSLSSVPAESSGPQNASSRRRRYLQDADAESFFDWLGGRNISCSALLRALFDPAQSSFSKDTLRQVRSRVNPFFGTIAAKSFIDNCPSAQESAVNYILRQVRKEASKASALPEISRPQGHSRAEDIRTFRLKSAVDILESNLPITFAVTQAIAGVGKDDDAPVENTSTAVEEAMSTLAPLASTADDEEALNEGASDSELQPLEDSGSDLAAAEEDELRDVWDDVGEDIRDDVEEGQPATADGNDGTEAEPKETAPVSRRRKGKRNPKIASSLLSFGLVESVR
ncbi:hypothetical protein CF335_g9200 [Tilletia laevis]|nr:hypothetical protein CF335_g9200 [Tilletia laevis]